MIWIRLGLSCLLTVGVAGSMAYILLRILEAVRKDKNPYVIMQGQKLGFVLYWLPFPFILTCVSRLYYTGYTWCVTGEFIMDRTPAVNGPFIKLGYIWLAGVILVVLWNGYRQWRLSCTWRGNVPIEQEELLTLFEEYKERFGISKIELYQNDLLKSPVSYGTRNYKIVVPYAQYTKKQFRMILEHEMNHIRSGDLQWRKLGLLTLMMHWYNPIVYVQLKYLILQQEIVCDMKAGIRNDWYSIKEYGCFLAGLSDNEIFNISSIALCESKKQVMRRINAMVTMRNVTKPTRRRLAISCIALMLFAMIPSGMVSAASADLQEKWIAANETEVEVLASNFEDKSVERYANSDDGVIEVEMSSDKNTRGSTIDLDATINTNTRMLYQTKYLLSGSKVTIAANCEDSSISYRIGIKNCDTGTMTYVPGSGSLLHTFTIETAGNYVAYVQNCSTKSMTVTGFATY